MSGQSLCKSNLTVTIQVTLTGTINYTQSHFCLISSCRRRGHYHSHTCIGYFLLLQLTLKVSYTRNLLGVFISILMVFLPLENVRNGAAFRCIEAVGQAIAYGMNTQTTSDPIIGLYASFSSSLIFFMHQLTVKSLVV